MDTTATGASERTHRAVAHLAAASPAQPRHNGHATHVRSFRRRAAEQQATAWVLRTRHPLPARAPQPAV